MCILWVSFRESDLKIAEAAYCFMPSLVPGELIDTSAKCYILATAASTFPDFQDQWAVILFSEGTETIA